MLLVLVFYNFEIMFFSNIKKAFSHRRRDRALLNVDNMLHKMSYSWTLYDDVKVMNVFEILKLRAI